MPSSCLLAAEPDAPVAARHAIEIRGLRKTYGGVTAVDELDLLVAAGEVYAFLGPNGAGKTTTVEILEGFRTADAGHVRVLGADPATAPAAWRDRIGVVLQESAPDPGLTVAETLQLHAGYHTRPRQVTPTLALVGLDDHAGGRAPSSPAASGDASTSRSPSSATRRSSSSTSPPPASTRPPAAPPGPSSTSCATPARRSS